MGLEQELQEKWMVFWNSLGCSDKSADSVWGLISGSYMNPGRSYHTLQHLSECLEAYDRVEECLENRDAVQMALWFHDLIYTTAHDQDAADSYVKRRDTGELKDELRSADTAKLILDGVGFDSEFTQKVYNLILSTYHLGAGETIPEDNDTRYMLDIDLSILGSDPIRYDRYTDEIRAEFGGIPLEFFSAGRRVYLEKFSSQAQEGTLFLTPEFAHMNTRALENINHELENL